MIKLLPNMDITEFIMDFNKIEKFNTMVALDRDEAGEWILVFFEKEGIKIIREDKSWIKIITNWFKKKFRA